MLETPFARAIQLDACTGTLLLVDERCTPMTRVWCVLEAFVTRVYATGKRFEVAAMIPAKSQLFGGVHIEPGPALRMDLGDGKFKEVVEPEHGWFPGEVATAGVAVAVETAQASKEKDRVAIMKVLAGSADRAGPLPESCKGYDDVNRAVHSLFRGPAIFAGSPLP